MPELLANPFERPIDLVIPWVNRADPAWARQMGWAPARPGFTELKYQLRSYESCGWLDHLRTVYVVHSDVHEPPAYLRRDHPRLRFVRHSELVERPERLPLTRQPAIAAHLHRIAGLSEWYLLAEDDLVTLQPWSTFSSLVWQAAGADTAGKLVVYTSDTVLEQYVPDDQEAALWTNGGVHASRLLADAFGPRARYRNSHYPRLTNLSVMRETEARWPEAFERTRDGRRDGLVCVEVLHDEYLVDTGRALRRGCADPHFRGRCYGTEIHTNDWYLAPPVTLRKAARLLRHCVMSHRHALFLNFQGPGISDEYDDVRTYRALMYGWLNWRFSRPSMFERS